MAHLSIQIFLYRLGKDFLESGFVTATMYIHLFSCSIDFDTINVNTITIMRGSKFS